MRVPEYSKPFKRPPSQFKDKPHNKKSYAIDPSELSKKIIMKEPMKIYIAGKITGLSNYKEIFKLTEDMLKEHGHTVMNPTILPQGFEHGEYMHICYSMIDVCDAVYFMANWEKSEGAQMEREYVRGTKKLILEDIYQEGWR